MCIRDSREIWQRQNPRDCRKLPRMVKKDDWGDMAFLMEYGDSVTKMAIVGEERWKENAFVFAGKGLRETEIEFFTRDKLDEAEGWIRL